MALIKAFPWVIPLFFGMIGLMVGSFLNVVIYRLPRMRTTPANEVFNLAVPRSRCPKCGHMISALENIPVLSYLVLRGKCYHCQCPISPRYPLVELFAGLVSAVLFGRMGVQVDAFFLVVLAWVLIVFMGFTLDNEIITWRWLVGAITLGLLSPLMWFIPFLMACLAAQFKPELLKGRGGAFLWGVFSLTLVLVA